MSTTKQGRIKFHEMKSSVHYGLPTSTVIVKIWTNLERREPWLAKDEDEDEQ
ncbi:hypothetical protein ACB092_10G013100 [Castanea dentata]